LPSELEPGPAWKASLPFYWHPLVALAPGFVPVLRGYSTSGIPPGGNTSGFRVRHLLSTNHSRSTHCSLSLETQSGVSGILPGLLPVLPRLKKVPTQLPTELLPGSPELVEEVRLFMQIRDKTIAPTVLQEFQLGERGNQGEPSSESQGAGLHYGLGRGQDLYQRRK